MDLPSSVRGLMSINNARSLLALFLAAFTAALSACTIQAKITDLGSASSGTFTYTLSGHSDFGTTSTTTYTSTKRNMTLAPATTGQMVSFSISPALPAGLSLNTTTGAITGRPTTPAVSSSWTITGTDGLGATSTQTLTFEVAGYYLVDTTTDAADASAGDNICATAASQCSLRAATQEAAAQSSGTLALIDLPAGTFTLSGSGVTISTRAILTGAGASNSIISGGGGGFILVTSSGSEVTLDGIAVRDSTLRGIHSTSLKMTLKNCDISNNAYNSTGSASQGIGFNYSNTSSEGVVIDNCTITNNSKVSSSALDLEGAGVSIAAGFLGSPGGLVTISNSSFQSNTSNATNASSDAWGSALYLQNTRTTITNTSFVSNSATSLSGVFGGAVSAYFVGNGSLSLNNVTCSSNSATGPTVAYGGCLGIFGGSSVTVSVTNSTFSANTMTSAIHRGGALYAQGVNTAVTDSVFSGTSNNLFHIIRNSAAGTATTSTITNSSFYNTGNQSAVRLETSAGTSTFTIEHSTISLNNAAGSTFVTSLTAADTVNVKNSIINVSGGATACTPGALGTKNSLGYNVARDATCTFLGGTDIQSSATIGLSALASNGGPTQTMAIGTGSSAYNLVPTGSCTLTTDQRGSARPNAGACDAGAYEY